MAGVSRTTVSFVLNNVTGMRISEETRQKVLTASRELNYHPDAYVECQSTDKAFADALLPEVLRGLHEAARQENYHVLFEPIPPNGNSSDRYSKLIRERHADGIVLSGPRFDDEELLRLHEEGFPVVLQGQLPGADIPFVDVDNVGGARLATEHLISLGHRRIALITNAPLVYTAAADRRIGYLHALSEAGLEVDESLIKAGSFNPQSGATAMEELLVADPRPTAVFVAGDTVAIGALQAAKRAGLHIPNDLAVVGFDDAPMAEFLDPPLTTVRLPAYGLGWGAGETLIRIVNDEQIQTSQIFLETELVIRKSCGATKRR